MGKVYVTVIAEHSVEKGVSPVELIWGDGRRFPVDKVVDCRRSASLKAGGQGMRYSCVIRGRQVFLFREEDRWFLEAREGSAGSVERERSTPGESGTRS